MLTIISYFIINLINSNSVDGVGRPYLCLLKRIIGNYFLYLQELERTVLDATVDNPDAINEQLVRFTTSVIRNTTLLVSDCLEVSSFFPIKICVFIHFSNIL